MVTDDGYVSRNVYDYDEPEPPADVREALTSRAAVDAYPHRNPYLDGGAYMGEERSRIPLREAFVAGARWADAHRTPTPHVVTTVERMQNELEFRVRTAVSLARRGRDINDEVAKGREGIRELATVLTPAPAPIDREVVARALREAADAIESNLPELSHNAANTQEAALNAALTAALRSGIKSATRRLRDRADKIEKGEGA